MKHTFKLIFAFLLLSGKLFGQYSEMVFSSSTNMDKSLKEVWEYSGNGKDSSLIAKEYYSEGLLQLRLSFWNDTLRKETTYKYNEYKLPWIITETFKDNKRKDTAKSMTVYLYDQYKNLYLKRHMDSVPNYVYDFRLRYQQFTNYIYQDSLIIYSNMINDLGDGFQGVYKRFEYDDKRHLKKVFTDDIYDTAANYILTDELFYDEIGNHIKTVHYCQNYITDREGNIKKQPCENDFSLYTYNSKQQLTEEFHYFHETPFMNVAYQKDTIKYNYNENGRLVSEIA